MPKPDIAKIDLNNPFTWVLTVNCGKQILKDCVAQVHPEFVGAASLKENRGVYLLPNQLRMGIVIIEQLAEATGLTIEQLQQLQLNNTNDRS